MKKAIGIIIAVLVVIAIAGISIYSVLDNRIKYNDSYVNGNSAGNLYNAGLFCESNGTVFFANPDDNYRLYSMDLDGSNLKKLCSDTAMYINADDNYVYYIRNNDENSVDYAFFTYARHSLCRIKRSGGSPKVLDREPCLYATLIGNYIYYLHYEDETASTLYRVGIDGKDMEQVQNTYVFTCSALGQYFYTNGTEKDGALYEYNTATNTHAKIYECNCYKPIVTSDNNVYYLDVNQDMALVHTNIEADQPITLTDDSIDLYNINGSYIYYQRYSKDNPAVCMIKNDGSEFKEIAPGNYSNISITSHNIYLTDYESKAVFYTPTSNPGELQPFHPGIIED